MRLAPPAFAAVLATSASLSAGLAVAAGAQGAARDTVRYVVLNHGRPAGEMTVARAGDSVLVRYWHVDRNRGPRTELRYRFAPDGRPVEGRSWSLPLDEPDAPRGEPLDRFEMARDSAFYSSRGTSPQRVRTAPGALYRLRGAGTAFDQAATARYLLGRPDRTAPLVPTGTLRAEVVADTTVRVQGRRQRARLVALHGPGGPSLVWLDERGELLASEAGWFITVRRGLEDVLPALRPTEIAWHNRRGAELARRLAPAPAAAVAITNGDVFDSERGVLLPNRTVVVRGERIVAVGPADSVAVPAGATVIDARGKTVMPGMWDMHNHLFTSSQTSRGPEQLAQGVTSVRDLASDLDIAVQHRDRAARGEILQPHVVLAGFLEGPGRWAGPTEVIVRDSAEAVRWVAYYDSLGYKQVKLYNLVQQDLVPVIAQEAHRRGMRVSGHVPRGLSVPAAIRLGYDEINHAAFLFSTFFQDSLYVPRMRAYSAVAAAVAPNVNVDGPEMSALIEDLKAHGTVVDGTFALWLRAPSQGASIGQAVGVPATSDSAEIRRNDANYLRLAKRLFDAGVALVPGTDGGSFNAELETYERAGIPAPAVLQIATIVSARVMKEDRDYGSVAPGKVADLVIVNGRPSERVADLRKVERVVRAGRVYEARTIQAALREPSR
ncbi:MAG: amidohydrolase family protein [Gemmatimonadaceae bacterium]